MSEERHCGDRRRVDRSLMVDALDKLKGIKGIAQVQLERSDIVRHRLVQNIVNAYERRAE